MTHGDKWGGILGASCASRFCPGTQLAFSSGGMRRCCRLKAGSMPRVIDAKAGHKTWQPHDS